MSKLFIVRGLPGSGKSTLASMIAQTEGCPHLEADCFFTNSRGEYRFEPLKLKEAHKECQASARWCLEHGSSVVVSNTFTQLWEMQPYLDMPHSFLQVIECKGKHQNIHDVPDDIIIKMANRWEPYA